ncbi:MAG: YARHG domain-containing protein [Spirochaetales bacterium]|nr:YARHG domain-containing protein [Spirochaetales bacterium]
MKKKQVFLFVLLLFGILPYCPANDGPFTLIGGTLKPFNNMDISLDYERLIITHSQKVFEVDVFIELNNHTDSVLEPTVGFEFMPSKNDIYYKSTFNNFVLLVNNEPQKFSFESIVNEESFEAISILLYKPKLNPGLNRIYHNYKVDERFSSGGHFIYILQTGSRWKGGIIKDFEIIIKTHDPGVICNREDSFSSFDIVGEGKNVQIDEIAGEHVYGESFSLNKGYLYKNIENFHPAQNLRFDFYPFFMDYYWGDMLDPSSLDILDPPLPVHKYIYHWKNSINRKNDEISGEFEEQIPKMNKNDLRILRNTIFALHGYIFNDKNLNEYFNNQYWYYPNPNIKYEDIHLDTATQKILDYIIKAEKR